MKYKLVIISIFIYQLSIAQTAWTWQELPEMPEPVSNNAVCEALVNDTAYVYSFCGIDTTKIYSGIGLNSYRYNTITQEWSTLPDVPDTLGKIAASANYVNGLIYIIGGYHVSPNSNEISSNKVHIFDPVSNTFLTDGTEIPIPIDDQVQAVWRDSLIYVVTGWSNFGNVNNVQIYDPFNDSWSIGTSTPNNNFYRAFGASGIFIEDTLFYNGGATGGSFNSTGKLRKGVIDPIDPTNITWTYSEDNPGAEGYRMSAVNIQDKAFWIGGSGVTYNFNGIAYNGSGGVPPLNRILRYNANEGTWFEGLGAPYGVMDLRGAAQLSDTEFIICGGMMADQQVSKRAFLLSFDILNSIDKLSPDQLIVYPSPFSDQLLLKGSFQNTNIRIIDLFGKEVYSIKRSGEEMTIQTKEWSSGTYIIQVENPENSLTKKIVKH